MASRRETPESLVKKRARDRRAQQNLRDKRVAQVEALKQRNSALNSELQSLQKTCYDLRQENGVLRGRQEQIQHLVNLWTRGPSQLDPSSIASLTLEGTQSCSPPLSIIQPRSYTDDAQSDAHQTPPETGSSPTVQIPQMSPTPLEDLTLPRWNMTPVHSKDEGALSDWISVYLSRADLVRSSPEDPKPVELLYGSKTNFLANAIHDVTRRRPCRDPERLAGGWLTYRLVKWMFEPSETRFARLQDFQKPVAEQLCHPHASFIDFMVWPALRTNFIKNQSAYDREEFIGLWTCCLKVRWAWNKRFLEPDDNGELVFSTDFYNTFTKPEGWGLTRDFLTRYPSLFIGLDIQSIHYEFADL
ncbi:uncharacterized protein F4822DRAFT_291513 [Hypoxylon trugodes]|uniref:uncharacterized protein n=1 Tax=Hypoxylon trugodes TaxID=326681 RepID=UPI00218D9ABC|nr:uncharacterized protein F4822DRAFT_291513 [Hypoxylon trugodes]KAI1387747.1 hypothetical protein F4822DRAFT_291513 [Hypoxylon trugodes]